MEASWQSPGSRIERRQHWGNTVIQGFNMGHSLPYAAASFMTWSHTSKKLCSWWVGQFDFNPCGVGQTTAQDPPT
eukprot:1161352-Pelagomonas_calceolata.AAC.16